MSRIAHLIGLALAHAALYADAAANALRTGCKPFKRQAMRDEITLDRQPHAGTVPVYAYRKPHR